jgi:hypothetical protein
LLRLLTAGWSPNAPQDARVRILSCALEQGFREALAQWLAEEEPDPLALVGLIYLLAVQHPEIAIDAIGHLTPNPARDDLCRRLICYGWIPAPEASRALKLIEDLSIRLEAELHLGARNPGSSAAAETWVRQLARLAAEKNVDSSDPKNEILVRHLWSVASGSSNEALAHATRAALASGDTFHAWATFHLWLHSLLSPLPAEKSPDRLRLAEDLLASLPGSLRLPAESPEPGRPVSER